MFRPITAFVSRSRRSAPHKSCRTCEADLFSAKREKKTTTSAQTGSLKSLKFHKLSKETSAMPIEIVCVGLNCQSCVGEHRNYHLPAHLRVWLLDISSKRHKKESTKTPLVIYFLIFTLSRRVELVFFYAAGQKPSSGSLMKWKTARTSRCANTIGHWLAGGTSPPPLSFEADEGVIRSDDVRTPFHRIRCDGCISPRLQERRLI